MKTRTMVSGAMVLLSLTACGGGEEKKPAETPTAPPATSASASAAMTTPEPSASPAPPASSAAPAPPPPAPKGKFTSLALAATSGKVDKIGNKDGAFTPDGVKDLVFDAEVEGPAIAFVIVSTDAGGQPNGTFSADTYVGSQTVPAGASADVKQGKTTAGIGVFEADKLANAKDGSLTPLADGKHKLSLHISSKDAPKGSFKAFVVFDEKNVIASPVAGSK